MVHQKVVKRAAVKYSDIEANVLMAALLAILMVAMTLVTYYLVAGLREEATSVAENITELGENVQESSGETKIEKVDFQPIIDEWVSSAGGNKSVLIYDLERDEIVGEYNTDVSYHTASLYKLFIVYEGYRRLESGEWQVDEPAGTTGHTVLECLELSIRESYSPCAETLWAKIGYDNLDRIIEADFKITNSDISSLTSNVGDIEKIMKLFYAHPDIKDEALVARMKDSFLNQPKTSYNWRQGLPSGFSEKVNVYNKVGWDYNAEEEYWNLYHDAAIVEFPEENRHFIVVVMTEKVPYQSIRKLGTKIEEAFYNN